MNNYYGSLLFPPVHSSFTEAVFDIFNCPHVRITDSHFQHNLGTSISNASSRGNTGGLAIGFKDPPTTHNFSAVTIEILNTTFVNNSANTSSLGVAINSTVYPGRGGALGIFISHSFDNVTVVIADCLFVRNFAGAYGGAVFYLIAQDSVEDNVYFRNTVFDSNMGNLGASGMMLVYIARDTERPAEMPALFNITDCVFKNHTSRSGGALAVFPSYFGGGGSRVVITNSTFTQNHENESDPFSYGSAIAISEINLFSDRSALPKHEIIDWYDEFVCTCDTSILGGGIYATMHLWGMVLQLLAKCVLSLYHFLVWLRTLNIQCYTRWSYY